MKYTIAPILITGLILIGAFFWTLPSGSGEYRDSPDGQYTAWASRMTRGTLSGRIHYVELRIEKKETGDVTWRIERMSDSTDAVSDFGDRPKRWIDWSKDSSTVAFTVGPGQQVIVPVQDRRDRK